jgi:tyrosinase
MWPWNGVTGDPRLDTAPGGGLARSPSATAPSPQPRVRDCLDYQGRINAVLHRQQLSYPPSAL